MRTTKGGANSTIDEEGKNEFFVGTETRKKNELSLHFQHLLIAMSLLPSSPAVSDRLSVLREERAAARAAFRSAVDAASIDWEAELLLSLEDFRDAGGFERIQASLQEQIQREQRLQRDESHIREHHHRNQVQIVPLRPAPVYRRDDAANQHLCDLFLADRLNLEEAFYAVTSAASKGEDITLYIAGDPTMASYRSALRIRILSGVRKEMYDAILAELKAQEDQKEKDRALLEERRRAVIEEQAARQRIQFGVRGLSGKRY